MKKAFAVVLLVLLWTIAIPSCGKRVDKLCIKGKAKGESAVWIQGLNPPYVIMKDGDRILRKECSELIRSLTFRNQYDQIRDFAELHLGIDWL